MAGDATQGLAPTGNQQSRPQDSTPPAKTPHHADDPRPQGREAREGTGEDGGGTTELKKPQHKIYRRDVENGGVLGGRRKKR